MKKSLSIILVLLLMFVSLNTVSYFDGAENLPRRDFLGWLAEDVAAAVTAHAFQQAVAHERMGELLEVFQRDVLGFRHMPQRDLLPLGKSRDVHHHAHRIAPFGGYEHGWILSRAFI